MLTFLCLLSFLVLFSCFAFASQNPGTPEYFKQLGQIFGPLAGKGDYNLKLTILNAVVNDSMMGLTSISEVDPKIISERFTSNTGDHTTLLHLARSAPVADWLIKQGAPINAYDAFGYTPLHATILRNNCGQVRLLLSKQADPYLFASETGENAFHMAVKHKRHPIAKLILQTKPEIVRSYDAFGRSGYYYVARAMPELFLDFEPEQVLDFCPPEALTILLSRKSELRQFLVKNLIMADHEKFRLLLQGMNIDPTKFLLEIGDLSMFEYYLNRCPPEHVSTYTPINGEAVNVLQAAIILQNREFVQFMLQRGFDPRSCTLFSKKSCLELAESFGNEEIIALIKAALV